MQLEEFNTMAAEDARRLVRPCVDIDSWVDAVVEGRPYADPAALLGRADEQARTWTAAEVEGALADHPRIGERHAGSGTSAAMSGREQAGVDPHDAEVQRRLAAGNAAYEERFDRIYLVRAAGRSAEEILALLEERLGNDPETEIAVTAGQLREIALLRLEGLLA
ncbi:2-oxo-4-hydroxy-4-carboxy-5-ureidoimidazoline decarboxylase [Nocardioides mangrovi]|uniref:2-oxo-4-hydroxy-4-carboxy-5-ureidoimidazoline decarboxylase n=1 Tax=Nocardioides mangrovi TaxID=2874580 RepID=A0ABS7UG95_9ACTN|nr:2-oxo-4-hydroxy-4-carboxy-5-ureidoimidazoline decarboxylase [Nocardioides mangrovi]MBZ5740064.1 2-oxo-4-hydroxy-4-carboxy-5-ureidoimidazoline decarboxylase [Nocardioides mangrovi]